ncbi:KTSC domain-containing protein [Halomicrococcus sp. NG-SE-24]|uniref:KTSC domain-containing protein n=1 Tax=unclassified Halomicrococcus TaxID=2614448 RepID=UPI003D99F067
MKANVSGGEQVECHDFEEGQHGVVLRDHEGATVGYVPYGNLEYVARTRTPVASSNLASVGYEPEEEVLEIAFRSGGVYRYFDVPDDVYRDLLSARSHGSYFHENVRDQYEYRRIR